MSATRRSLRLALSLSLSILWLVLVSACLGPNRSATPAASPAPATSAATPGTQAPKPKPEKGGSVAVAIPAPPAPLNFTLPQNDASRWVLDTVDARMVRLTANGSYEPVLLDEVPNPENGGLSADGLSWTLHFRPKLEWSDGQPLTADDLKFTWETMTNQRYPARGRAGWSDIVSVTVSSDRLTAILQLRRPDAAFLDEVIVGADGAPGGFLLPAHVLAAVPVEQIPGNDYGGSGHVGSGPFKIAKLDPGGQVTVERNDRYSGDTSLLDRIIFRVVPEVREALGDLGSGEIDLAPSIPTAYLPTLDQLTDVRTVSVLEAGAVAMLAFNLDHPPLDDLTVRQAIALGFDRGRVSQQIVPGQPPQAATPLSGTSWSEGVPATPYDPAQAAQLLDADGWRLLPSGIRSRDGVRLSFGISTLAGNDPEASLHQRIEAQFIADMARIGIEVIPRNLNAADLTGATESGDFDCVDLWGDGRSGVVEFAARFGSNVIRTAGQSGDNIMGYHSSAVDAALERAAAAATPAEQIAALQDAQRQIAHDVPVIPIFVHREVDAAQTHVQGLEPGVRSGLFWNVEAWWLMREQKAP